jgi:acetyl-CoA acetyltransferase
MTSKHSVVIAEPVRTAIGTFGGTLKDISAVDLGKVAISAALRRSGLRPDEIGTVVMGNAVQAGNKMNPARQADGSRGTAGASPRDDCESGLWLRCTSDRLGGTRNLDGFGG